MSIKIRVPMHLSHKPIIAVDYKARDTYGDAEYLSLGFAQWHKDLPKEKRDISLKIFRKSSGAWSRQSEETTLFRAIDMVVLLISYLSNTKSGLDEVQVGTKEDVLLLDNFIKKNHNDLLDRLARLKSILDKNLKNINVSITTDK